FGTPASRITFSHSLCISTPPQRRSIRRQARGPFSSGYFIAESSPPPYNGIPCCRRVHATRVALQQVRTLGRWLAAIHVGRSRSPDLPDATQQPGRFGPRSPARRRRAQCRPCRARRARATEHRSSRFERLRDGTCPVQGGPQSEAKMRKFRWLWSAPVLALVLAGSAHAGTLATPPRLPREKIRREPHRARRRSWCVG